MENRATFLVLLACILGTCWSAYSQTVCGNWDFVTSPNIGQEENRVRSISAVSENDIWAVGFHDASSGSSFLPRALIMHWDGTNWNTVPAPSVGISGDFLLGVAAVSGNNVWAVGFSSNFGEAQTLTLHWDGSSWSVVPSPTYTGGSALWAVGALSENEIWAVGERVVGAPGPTGGTLTLRWNGSSWEEIPSPNPPGTAENNSLYAIGIVSDNDIWAVGQNDVPGNFKHALLLHWDGSSWTIVSNPHDNSNTDTEVVAVSGGASNDVWTSGVIQTFNGVRPLFMHWDGSSWSIVTSPGGVAPYFGGHSGLASISPNDVWAVGRTIAHWDGGAWSLVDFTSPGTGAELHAVARVSSCNLWSAGDFFDGNTTVTLVEHLTAGSTNQPPVVSDIPNQTVPAGGRFAPIRADNYVTDPDNPDTDITWTWSGNSSLRVTWDGIRRRIIVRPVRDWTGTENITFTATDPDGFSDSDQATFTVSASLSGIALDGAPADVQVTSETTLEGNYPNPFNPQTTIRYVLEKPSLVSLVVYDVLGQQVAVLADGPQEEGYHEAVFDGRNLPSGVYTCRMSTGEYVQFRKLVLTK